MLRFASVSAVPLVAAAPATTRQLFDQPAPLSWARLGDAFRQFASSLVDRLPNLLAALIAILLAVALARLARRAVEAALRRPQTAEHVQEHVHLLLGKLASLGVLVFGVVVALSLAGVNLGWLVGSLGLATIAVGFALQDILANFVAGIVLLLEHPFTRGDSIAIEQASGTVEDVRVRATQLRTADGQQLTVPNKLLFTSVLFNATASVGRRAEVAVRVAFDQDEKPVSSAMLEAASSVAEVAAEPPPRLVTTDLDASGMVVAVRFWVDPRVADVDDVKSEVVQRVRAALPAATARAGATVAPRDSAAVAATGTE